MTKFTELSFFIHFPDDLIEEIEKSARTMHYEPGDEILRQGQTNQSLYFLVEGQLGVFVDGGRVASLDSIGELIGEMSLISKQKVTATIKAESKVTMFKLDSLDLEQISKKSQHSDFSLYKVYSDVLSQKLEETNHKAKHFEDLTMELQDAHEKLVDANASLEQKVKERTAELREKYDELEQKATELSTSNEKLLDLYKNRDSTYESLETLLHENLIPLRKGINLLKGDDDHQNVSIIEAEKEIAKAIDKLSPLTANYSAEKELKSKRVLVAESISNQRIVAKMALGGTGVELDIVSTLEEGQDKLAENQYDIVLFDKDLKDLSVLAKEKNPDTRFVFVTSQDIPSYLPTLMNHPFFPNVVSKDIEDRQFTIKNFTTTVLKLSTNNLFGMEKYLSWGVEIKAHDVVASDERRDLIDNMSAYFKKSGMRASNRDRCSAVAEELLMNAIYDAPRDADGKSLYNHIDRKQRIELAPEHQAKFKYATDGVILAVSIEDPFGALDIRTIFRYLEKCYTSTGSLNDNDDQKAGGGRGLHQIIENSDLVVFNVDPNKRTEVIAFFNADTKQATDRAPNLHFFTTETTAASAKKPKAA